MNEEEKLKMAYKLIQEEKYDEAAKIYFPLARKGCATAQIDAGICCLKGWGVPVNDTAAMKWFTRAAKKDIAYAQYCLARCYHHIVLCDRKKALAWYRKAADQGQREAQTILGVWYFYGREVDEDKATAVTWFEKAAAQGDMDAQYNLAFCYSCGYGVDRDVAKAVEWFREAAKQGDGDAKTILGICYSTGKGVKVNKKVALTWYYGHMYPTKESKDLYKRLTENIMTAMNTDVASNVMPEKEVFRNIGINIRCYRVYKAMTREELAERACISQYCLTNIERGAKVENIPMAAYVRIAKALDIDVWKLCSGKY